MRRLTTWIINSPLHDEEAGYTILGGRRHHLNISSLRVCGTNDGAVPFPHADGEDLHIVTCVSWSIWPSSREVMSILP